MYYSVPRGEVAVMWSIIICACRYCYSVHLIFDKVLLAFSNNGTIIFIY